MIAEKSGNPKAKILAETLDIAVGDYLNNGRTPSRKVNEIDNRGSSFYLAMYWAQALANQDKDEELRKHFAKVAKELEENEEVINNELLEAQGKTVDLGGYYLLDDNLAEKAMRPSETLNSIIDSI